MITDDLGRPMRFLELGQGGYGVVTLEPFLADEYREMQARLNAMSNVIGNHVWPRRLTDPPKNEDK